MQYLSGVVLEKYEMFKYIKKNILRNFYIILHKLKDDACVNFKEIFILFDTNWKNDACTLHVYWDTFFVNLKKISCGVNLGESLKVLKVCIFEIYIKQ